MNMKKKMFYFKNYFFIMMLISTEVVCQTSKLNKDEIHRPQIHFSPQAHWVNDPNGMVYNKGVYHLFYQHHPYSSVWGPMHWGHATSRDMINWKHQPIAIYPDSLGTIFSGSAVVDKNNTSGFGKNGQAPLVAIFTQHSAEGEKAGRIDFQNQSIAYSNDNGKTWVKYSDNPVLKNPGIVDFRDPKVMWYAPHKKWIMSLATKDRITFYSSINLKNWEKESEFGATVGAHGGVWECPDLFTLDDNGKKVWVLLVSINPGGPNNGSATQYFVGDFDGNKFIPYSTDTKWIDYGPDNYAGITWSNTGARKIFLGWMSNWMYANKVPTETWRNAMTIPRELQIKHVVDELLIASFPIKELSKIQSKPVIISDIKITNTTDITTNLDKVRFPCRLNLKSDEVKDFSLIFSNSENEKLVIGFDKNKNQYYIDRTKSGVVNFHTEFAERHVVPRFTDNKRMNISLLIDVSSVELFADDGLSVMTEIFFPNKPYTRLQIQSLEDFNIKNLEYFSLKNIWK